MSSTYPVARRKFRGRLALTLLFSFLLLATGPLLLLHSISVLRANGQFHDQVFSLITLAASAQSRRLSSDFLAGQFQLERTLAHPRLVNALDNAIHVNNREDPAFLSYRQAVVDDLQMINQPRLFYDQFLIVLPDGDILISSNRDWEGQKLTGSQLFFGLNGGTISLAVYSFPPLYPDSFIILTSVPYLDSQGDLVATALGITDSQTIWEKVNNTALQSTNQYFVTGDGQFIGANPFSRSANKLVILYPDEPYKQAIQNGLSRGNRQGVLELQSFENQKVFAAYSWLPELEAGLIVEIPQANIYSPLETIQLLASLMLFTTFVLFLLIYWNYQRHILQPVQELSVTLRRFAEGDWALRLPVRGNNEIGLSDRSFNRMAEKLAGVYHSLESKVVESSHQLSAIAEVSQITNTSVNLKEFLTRTTHLIIERLSYAYAAIYLVDEISEFILLVQEAAPPDFKKTISKRKLKIDTQTPIGWAAIYKQPYSYIPAQVESPSGIHDDPTQEAFYGLALPLLVGDQILGILDLQAIDPAAFSQENHQTLHILADMIALGIQKFKFIGLNQTNQDEGGFFYRSIQLIAQAETEEQVLTIFRNTLRQTPFSAIFLIAESEGFHPILISHDLPDRNAPLPDWLPVPPVQVEGLLPDTAPVLISDADRASELPDALLDIPRQFNFTSSAFLPIAPSDRLAAILVLGTRQGSAQPGGVLVQTPLHSYGDLAETAVVSIEKIRAYQNSQKRLSVLEFLGARRELISSADGPDSLFRSIHETILKLFAGSGFLVALYNRDTDQIEITYRVEEGNTINVPAYPLGEDMISTLIRTGQPLLFDEDMQDRMRVLGADVPHRSPKSMVGVPISINGETIGALIVQDFEHEHRFNLEDHSTLSSIAVEVASALRVLRLVQESQRQAERERLVSEISDKLRASNNPEVILQTAARELLQALGASQAQVLLDERRGAIKPSNSE